LEETGICDLSKETGYWKIICTGSEIRIDYVDFLNINSLTGTPSRQDIRRFIDITGKGSFLSDLNYEWLDDFKALVSDKVIDTLLKFGLSVDVKKEPEFMIELADSILNFDMVNEEAMILKCQAEYFMGNYSLAKATYESFSKKFLVMYGQEYDRTFLEILDERKN
jgi:two-component SAPR family response regulator